MGGPYSKNIGSRTYLMKDDYAYNLFQLKNKEFTYTVVDSKLDCGLNGALYFVQMDADGGKAKYGNAGAELGLGYCDAQCPQHEQAGLRRSGHDPEPIIDDARACRTRQ